jgi:hypothetical protein
MKLCLKILAIAATAATTYSLVSCAAPASFSYSNVSISLTANCTDCPGGVVFNQAYPTPSLNGTAAPGTIPVGAVLAMPNTGEGGTVGIYATVTNAPATNATWQIYPQPNLAGITVLPTGTAPPGATGGVTESTPAYGTFTTPAGSSTTASGPSVYFNVGGPPVFSGAALAQATAMGIPQGYEMIVVSVPSDPQNPSAVATFNLLVEPYGGSTAQGPPTTYLTPHTPTTPSGLVNPVVTVAHNPNLLSTPSVIATGGQYQFYGGVVGAAACLTVSNCIIGGVQYPLYTVDNTAVWEVGPAPFSLSTAFPCTTPGPACPFGTITSTGLYTAPAAIPSAGLTPASEVVVVVVSQLVTTVDSYAYVGLY